MSQRVVSARRASERRYHSSLQPAKEDRSHEKIQAQEAQRRAAAASALRLEVPTAWLRAGGLRPLHSALMPSAARA